MFNEVALEAWLTIDSCYLIGWNAGITDRDPRGDLRGITSVITGGMIRLGSMQRAPHAVIPAVITQSDGAEALHGVNSSHGMTA